MFETAAIELYTPQGAQTVSGMIYEPDEQGVINKVTNGKRTLTTSLVDTWAHY